MDIDEMTIRQAREVARFIGGASGPKPCPFQVGSAYMIRTVTMTWTGRVVAIVGDFLVLEDAAWIADTGRFHSATSEENLKEVEPVEGIVFVGLGAVVDARAWTSELPRSVK